MSWVQAGTARVTQISMSESANYPPQQCFYSELRVTCFPHLTVINIPQCVALIFVRHTLPKYEYVCSLQALGVNCPHMCHVLRPTQNLFITRFIIKRFQLIPLIRDLMFSDKTVNNLVCLSHLSHPPTPSINFCFSCSGPLHARELQIPPPARSPEDPVGDQRAK